MLINSLNPFNPLNHKQIILANSFSSSSLPNSKQTISPNSSGLFGPSNYKWTALLDSLSITYTNIIYIDKSFLSIKKQRYFNVFLLQNYIKWPILD